MAEERQLIQTKVDKELYLRFKVIQDKEGYTLRKMFEDWMKFELDNYDARMRGDVSGSFTRAWALR